MKKTITVFSNDPAQPRYLLTVSGTVEIVAGFEPDRLDLEHVPKGATVTRTAKIAIKDPKKLKITEVISSRPDQLSAELTKLEGQPAVKVTFKAPDKIGRISERVTAKTNQEKPKELQLFVFGQVSDDIVAERPFVFFPAPTAKGLDHSIARAYSNILAPLLDKNRAIQLRIYSLAGKPFAIQSIEDPTGAVIGMAKKYNQDWQVLLVLANAVRSPQGKIRILTDREDQPALEVSYSSRTTIRPMIQPPSPGFPAHQPVKLIPPFAQQRPEGNRYRIAPKLQKLPVPIPGGPKVIPAKPKPPQPEK